MKKLLLLGASGHGKVVADIAHKNNYEEICFLDDRTDIDHCLNFPIIGRIHELSKFPDYDVFVSIGNTAIRKQLLKVCWQQNRTIPTLVHPSAVIGLDVQIGEGSVVMAGSIINPSSRIGKGCIINTGATIDHDNIIQDYTHVSVGSHLCGTVSVGASTWVGAGSCVSNNLSICSNCMIGAGAVVVKNIVEPGTYIGVPARKIINTI